MTTDHLIPFCYHGHGKHQPWSWEEFYLNSFHHGLNMGKSYIGISKTIWELPNMYLACSIPLMMSGISKDKQWTFLLLFMQFPFLGAWFGLDLSIMILIFYFALTKPWSFRILQNLVSISGLLISLFSHITLSKYCLSQCWIMIQYSQIPD